MHMMTGPYIPAKLPVMLYILLKYFPSSALYCVLLKKTETKLEHLNARSLVWFRFPQLYERPSDDCRSIVCLSSTKDTLQDEHP